MEKLSDNEVKKLFKFLKALMFWPHPIEYDDYKVPFHMQDNGFDRAYESFPRDELLRLTQELYAFIKYFPLSIYIETTNRCNLSCIMCPHKKFKREKGDMSQKLFCKIIDEIAEKQPSITAALFYLGEPLMDKHIFRKIKYCKRKGLTYVKLSTNGSLLSVNENYKKLIDSGIDILVISFDGISKETYERIRIGSSFDNFIEGVDKVVDYKQKSGSQTILVGQMINMDNNSNEKEMFSEFIKKRGLRPNFMPLQYWGQVLPNMEKLCHLKYPCNNPFYSAVILVNGELNACCMDYDGKYILGNLNFDSLENLWQKRYKLLIKAQLNGQKDLYPICSNCYDWMNFGYNKFAEFIKETLISERGV